MNYIEVYITKQSKRAGNQTIYYPYDEVTKRFKTMEECKKWLKDKYGKSQRKVMYRDDKEGKPEKVGYVIGFKNYDYECGKKYTYYERHWIEIVEVETRNPFVK
jgi:hypothetical protein